MNCKYSPYYGRDKYIGNVEVDKEMINQKAVCQYYIKYGDLSYQHRFCVEKNSNHFELFLYKNIPKLYLILGVTRTSNGKKEIFYFNKWTYYGFLDGGHHDCVFYRRYIDEGIIDIYISKRKNFLRMMEDTKDGHFDLIVTSGVLRFARNTVETFLQTQLL